LDKALAEIEMNRGVLYDSEVADACLWLLKVGNYQLDDN
jgi:hypothetical protein